MLMVERRNSMELIQTYNKFLKPNLDVLFVALNPAKESNKNGHYFSGSRSLFYRRWYEAGLLTEDVHSRRTVDSDDVVFGTTAINYKDKSFGVIDIVKDIAESKGSSVKISDEAYAEFIMDLRENNPKNIVIIMSFVKEKINRKEKIKLVYGPNGQALKHLGINANVFCFPFPNGSSFSASQIIDYYSQLKDVL